MLLLGLATLPLYLHIMMWREIRSHSAPSHSQEPGVSAAARLWNLSGQIYRLLPSLFHKSHPKPVSNAIFVV